MPPIISSGLQGTIVDSGSYKITAEVTLASPTISGQMKYGYNTSVVPITTTFAADQMPYSLNLTSGASLVVSGASKILGINKVTLNSVKYPESSGASDAQINAFNRMKFFLIASGNSGWYYPITYVSNGDPIKRATD